MDTRMTPDSASTKEPLRVRFDRFEIDEANASLMCDGQAVPLAPRPFELLCALARTPRVLITKNELLDRVWGHRFVSDAVLRTAVSDLRSALGEDPRRARIIETVSRRGYRFIGALANHHPAPAAHPGAGPPVRSPIVERSDALDRLRTAWQHACAGSRQIVWVAGEAGVGKTTLIERFVSEVGEMHCAHGQCLDQHGAQDSFLPVLDALTALCRRDSELAGLMATVAPSWLAQLPWLGGAAEGQRGHGEPGGGRACVLREMGELLDRCTGERPLLLVTEDLHWSDPATVQLIDYLARRRSPAKLLWLASFRLTEVIASDHPLSAARRELGLHGLTKEIVLDAFSEEEVAEYLATRAPALAADEDFVRALHHRTDGLPLFVADLVDELMTKGDFAVAGGPPARSLLAATGIPDALSGIVERYVAQLTADQRSALEVASVCGPQFRLSTVARVLGRDVGALATSWAELTHGKRWLREAPSNRPADADEPLYAFRHALYCEVLQKRMGRLARAELQSKVADVRTRGCGEQAPATRMWSPCGGLPDPGRPVMSCAAAAAGAPAKAPKGRSLAPDERR
jgi:DNA-binding winged helix-turn-helix (wHTH) protein